MGATRSRRLGSILLLACILIAFEIFARLVFPVPEFEGFNRVAYSPTYSNIGNNPKAYLRNDSFEIASEPDNVKAVYRLNLYGFRDRDWNSRTRPRRVMFVGDSFVEGYLSDAMNTIPRGFADAGAARGVMVEAMNLGVTGAGLLEYARIISDAAPLFSPDDVILVLYANDFPSSMTAEEILTRSEFPRVNRLLPRAVDVSLRLVQRERVALAWHRQPVPYFPAVPNPGNPWTRHAARYRFVEPAFAEAMKAGRINPFLVNEINWYYRMLVLPANVEPALDSIRGELDKIGTRLHVVYLPSRHQVTTYYREYAKAFCAADKLYDLTGTDFQTHAAAVGQACEERQVPFLDLTEPLRKREAAGERMYLDYDGHFRAATYRLAGEWIYDWWERSAESIPDE